MSRRNSLNRLPSLVVMVLCMALILPASAQADEGLSTTRDTTSIELAPAAERSPFFVEADGGATIRPGLSSAWGTMPVNTNVQAGGGMWRSHSLGIFGSVGIISRASIDVERFRDVGTVGERFRLTPLRAGFKFNLRPRPDWVQLNVIAAGSVAIGSREFMSGNDILHRESIFSLGGGGGLELAVTKFKRSGASIKAQYFAQPAALDEHAGYLTDGLTELGGLEITLGVIYYLGGPK